MSPAVFANPFAFLLDAFGFVRFVVRRWTEDRCPQIAGSLAFATVLALVPMFAVVVALLSGTPLFHEVMTQLKAFLRLNLVPEIAERIINSYLPEFAANARRLTTIGVGFLSVTAVAMMLTVDRSLNAIWRTKERRPFLLSVAAYAALLAVGPLLIVVSVSITTYLMSFPQHWSGLPAPAHSVVLEVVPTTVSSLAFFLIYRLVPHGGAPWGPALVGGVVAGVLFEAAKEGFGVYVAHAPALSVAYGASTALPLFLLWIYLSWLIVLFGAELGAAIGEWPEEVRTGRRGKARSARSSR
jgi:membrane protein